MSTSSRLQLQLHNLPEDILFKIGSFLLPLDIIRLRQTAKWTRDFTSHRTFWTCCFRNSPLFLPPVKLEHQENVTLERLLIRAQRLDAYWDGNVHQIKHQRRLPFQLSRDGIRAIELYLGQYLLVGFFSGFSLFDLDRVDWDTPIFHISEDRVRFAYRTGYNRRSNSHYSGEVYIPIIRMDNSPESSIVLWQLRTTQYPPLIKIDNISINFSVASSAWVAHGFLIYHLGQTSSSYPLVYHITTQKRYQFESVSQHISQTVWTNHIYHHEYIPTARYILAMHIGYQETILEAFRVSNADMLVRTHFGVCPKGLTEPALISSVPEEVDLSSGTVITLSLAAIFHHDGLQAFRAFLHRNGTISFELPSAKGSSSYSLTVSSNLHERARAASRSANSTITLHLHDIDFRKSSDEPTEAVGVCPSSIVVPELADGVDHAWDGFKGRLCIQNDSHVDILDFV
ncbi:hypothetical protein E1B28_010176 [Marasmius oreades]|uniref:F-box domain-containing protein n=1 Tax=Marasmius oreades TaxID=181124 RepID=A0A9P7RWR6_9AGAR|nr:uncharacterized protein E1B28_010176 [Marasmius oreades]KAG7091122.1 hypothetical protein E1B28_010176 [Marasmius oreades]